MSETDRAMIPSEATTAGAVRQSVGAGLNALAAECHRLAVARGKYPSVWTPIHGCFAIEQEVEEWWREAGDDPEREAQEMGDVIATVLSIAHHRGIDVEAALEGAIRRNRERAGRGE